MNSKLHLYLLNSALIFSAVVAIATIIPLSNYVYGQGPQTNDSSLFPELPPGFEFPSESDSLPPVLMPDVNLSELSEFDSPSDFESSESRLPDVVGTYINPDIGFQVDLPKEWKGKEVSFLANSVFAAPQEIDLKNFEEPGIFMTIVGINEETFNKLAEFASLPDLGGAGGESAQGGSPLDITSAYGNNVSCNQLSSSFVSINGVNAEQTSQECTNEEGTDVKAKAYAFATQDDSLIVIGFLSNSTGSYNQYLPLFEESVKTIKISQPGDIATSQTYKKAKELESTFNRTVS
jgi:hypothetical protein